MEHNQSLHGCMYRGCVVFRLDIRKQREFENNVSLDSQFLNVVSIHSLYQSPPPPYTHTALLETDPAGDLPLTVGDIGS